MYEDPNRYSKFSEDHQKEIKWAMDQYWRKLRWSSGENILDVGCGPGDATHNVIMPALPQSFNKLIGVDMSTQMVSFASCWASSKLSFKVLDIATSEAPLEEFDKDIRLAGGFDKIFSYFCLQWVKDKRRMAQNIYNLLKPGGQGHLLLVVRSGVYNVWDKLGASEKWRPYLADINRPLNDYIYMEDYGEYLSEILTEAGLVVDDFKAIHRQDVFTTKTDSEEEMTLRLRSVDPFVSLLPKDKKDEYLTELRELVKDGVSKRGATDYTGLHILVRKA